MKDDLDSGGRLKPGEWLQLSRPSLDRFPLREWLSARGFEPASRSDPDELIGQCPGCGKRKLQVWCCGHESRWQCWTCRQSPGPTNRGAGGVLKLVELLESCDRDRAWEIIGQHQTQLDLTKLGHIQTQPKAEPHIPTALPAGALPVDPNAMHPYLVQRRRLTPDDAWVHKLYWIPETFPSVYRGRVVFPVRDAAGQVVYWQARAMRDPAPGEVGFKKVLNPRVLSPQHIGASDVLFNQHQAGWYGASARTVVLTEAPLNAITVGPDGLASMGKSLSPKQAALILQITQPGWVVVVLYDGPKQKPDGTWGGDTAKEALASAQLLSATRDVRIGRLPWGDPNDHPRAFNRSVIAQATPLHHIGGFWTSP